eukprot:7636367-Ditylum_brightwellii.AAC.1
MSKNNNGIVTYSISLVSPILVKEVGIKPSSGHWTMTQAQINAKESAPILEKLMECRFKNWYEVQKRKKISIAFYELGYGKCLYMMTGNSPWNVTHHPFIGCKCRRSDGVNEAFSCKTWSDGEYMEAIKK